jgi:TRAP-type C4-dicarboxylate transport system permease large subunit
MLRGGISERLIGFASALVGRVRGGLGQVSVLSSLFFGGVSGSALADVSAVGGTMIPQMIKRGYDRDYAVNVCMTAALVALLVPPSHNLILFSAAAGGGISITDLFAAGIMPALLMTGDDDHRLADAAAYYATERFRFGRTAPVSWALPGCCWWR